MALKPWYQVVMPREDLREGKPLDAAEFAVHLDHVRDGRAPKDYQDAERFFERTYLTKGLTDVAAEVIRRLSGEKSASAIYNMTTQFGGGKTHALTLFYHLATKGPLADKYTGVGSILSKAQASHVPKAACAVFVGTEFDSLTGRGGADGTTLRKTPWGEIAFQLGGEASLRVVAKHEEKMIAPGGQVIREMLPKDTPCIILMDELMNYISRFRKMGLGSQLYDFLHNLGEVARAEDRVVLVISVPASELEMSQEDWADYERLKKMLDRIGKPVVMSAGSETSEIIRRRLFEWDGIPEEGRKVIREYTKWALDHRQLIPADSPIDNAQAQFEATYPFHPAVLSVFERKWQSLPRFQQTRGILRLLALWISLNFKRGFTGGQKDPLIDLGSAPLDDAMFRAAVFEQLGESRLEAAVTTDIAGKMNSHAVRKDEDERDSIGKARLHQKVATTIFFESSGGQKQLVATIPEIRFAVGGPQIDIANIETVLEALSPPGGVCFYLDTNQNRYWFSQKPNLTKMHVNRLPIIKNEKVQEWVIAEIERVFQKKADIKPVFFPEKSIQISDRPELSLLVMSPDWNPQDPKACEFIQSLITEHGTSGRTFKNALLFAVADTDALLKKEARNGLAWEEIHNDQATLGLDEQQISQIVSHIKGSQRNLIEAVWRSYKFIVLLGKENKLQMVDLGLNNSGSAPSIVSLILQRLRGDDIVSFEVGPTFLTRKWPSQQGRWSTKSVRDAFFASPLFPRLIHPDSIKETISKGLSDGRFGYAAEVSPGKYSTILFKEPLSPSEVEISDDVFILTPDEVQRIKEPQKLTSLEITPNSMSLKPGDSLRFTVIGKDSRQQPMELKGLIWKTTGGKISEDGTFVAGTHEGVYTVNASLEEVSATAKVEINKKVSPKKKSMLTWRGEIQPQKWMNFYTKVLSRFATKKSLKINVDFTFVEENGISEQLIEETKTSLREIGLNDEVTATEKGDLEYI